MSPDKTNTSTTPTLQISVEDIVAEARKWLGVRWIHQGRSAHGVDCAGMIIKVGEALGAKSDDKTGYKRHPNAIEFLTHIRSQTDLADGPAPGRIAVFRQSKFPCHTGIFSEKDGVLHLIHSYIGTGKVIEEPFANHWPSLLVEVRTYRGREV